MVNNPIKFYGPSDTREIVNINDIENPMILFNYLLDYNPKDKKFSKRDLKWKELSDLTERIKTRRYNLVCNLAKKYDVRGIQAQVSWRLVVGLGQEHIQETSMCLDYIYGVPYIPGSAIKGVLRHYYIGNVICSYFPNERAKIAENILDKFEKNDLDLTNDKLSSKYKFVERDNGGEKVETLPTEDTLSILRKKPEVIECIQKGQKIFGTQDKKGGVIFLDAIPDSLKRENLVNDVMTPHYSEYYSKGQPPVDSSNPVPITFLTLERAKFNFYFLGRDKYILDEIWNGEQGLLAKALEQNGIGAKTSVGYGYFENIRDIKIEAPTEDSTKQEQASEIDLESMAEVEKICYFLEKYRNAENPEEYESYSYDVFARLDEFTGDEKIAIAKALKSYWIKMENKWEGKLSKKQKPKVDKVKSILGEK